MSAWSDIWDVIKGVAAVDTGNVGGVENAATGLTDAAASSPQAGFFASVTAFLIALTDWHLWASLGWLLAGLVLIVMGARLWLGKPALPSPPPVIPV